MGYYREVGLGYTIAPYNGGIRLVSSIIGIVFYSGVKLASSRVVLLDFTSFLDLFIVIDFFGVEDLSI
jgi:hypothetical protein